MSLFLPLPSFPLSVTLSHSLSFQGEGMWVVRVIWFQTADIYLETAAVFPLLRVFKYLHIPLTLTCYSWTRPLLPCPGLSSDQVHYTLSYRIKVILRQKGLPVSYTDPVSIAPQKTKTDVVASYCDHTDYSFGTKLLP